MVEIFLDKIGSVTKNLNLPNTVKLTDDIRIEMGTVLAVEALQDKSIYNEMELPSGRMSKMKKGDVLAVALGSRMGLNGFTGKIPDSIKVGDIIHVLNVGGVAGECTSANKKQVGEPLQAKVLGAIERDGKALNINQAKLFEPAKKLINPAPLIIVTGTGMDSGKTTVASEVIKTLCRLGMDLSGTKLSGVGAQRDLYKMADYGVKETVSFVDAGITSTAELPPELIVETAKGAINHLSKRNPDGIMVEFGDGLFGRYGVAALLSDKEIQSHVRLHIGCARDPVGAKALAEECAKIGVPLDIISGPTTDNKVGQDFIRDVIKLMPYNAFDPNNDLIDLVISKWTHLEKSAHRLSA